jgi:hypothetical protein
MLTGREQQTFHPHLVTCLHVTSAGDKIQHWWPKTATSGTLEEIGGRCPPCNLKLVGSAHPTELKIAN